MFTKLPHTINLLLSQLCLLVQWGWGSLEIGLCRMCSKSFPFFSAAILQNLTYFAHYCSHFSVSYLRGRVSRLPIQKCFPHGDRMAPFVFLQVPSTLGLQSAKNGCYSGTCIATFHSVLPCHMRSYKRLHNFSRQCPCST